ncbi:Medium chain reductase/dehydrogenase ucsI [Exophiala dermatitidis]
MATKDTMQAVVFKGKLQVAVEQRPIPKIQDPQDVIVKVRYTALCGSELHLFRGHEPAEPGFIMGHEFTGEVVELGSEVKTVRKGDMIVTPFTTSCGDCFYCKKGNSSRCATSKPFGSPILDGGQAEYCRIPDADSTVFKAPTNIDQNKLVLMADIFPTGYFAASNAFRGTAEEDIAESVVLLIGCGPVGLCALVNALEFKPKIVLAIDGVESRLQQAKALGAEPWNYQKDMEGLRKRVLELTDGRGADTVIELVGHSDALRMGFDLLRPWGNISSIGVHNGEIPWSGADAYNKNLRIQMGRCPVRSLFEPALNNLVKNQHKLEFMTENIKPLSEAPKWYDEFNNMKVQKIVFEADN